MRPDHQLYLHLLHGPVGEGRYLGLAHLVERSGVGLNGPRCAAGLRVNKMTPEWGELPFYGGTVQYNSADFMVWGASTTRVSKERVMSLEKESACSRE